MMKRLFLFITLLIIVLFVAGCNGNHSDKIVVTIGMWPEPYLKEDVEMFNEWKRLFEEDHPEYEIKGAPYTYSVETFFPMAQSGTTPTVFQTWFTEPQKLIENGFVKDITDHLEELGWLDKMDPIMRDMLSKDGRVYGVPRDGYGLGLLINLEIFAEVGLVEDWDGDGIYDIVDPEGNPCYPTTFEELAETAEYITKTMAELGQDVAGLIILSSNNNGGWQFTNIAWNFGAELQYQKEDGQWISHLDHPGAVAALEWIKEMKWERNALPADATLTYADWYNYIGTNRAAMAFVGNDAISLPIVNFGMDRNHLAFVPMPAGPEGHQFSLFGGTPYMFAAHATDEQIRGALLFLEYMGRSPETSEIAVSSMRVGMRVADQKGMPILPTIKAWANEDYLTLAEQIEKEFVNVNMRNFSPFFDTLDELRKPEPPHYAQEMYEILDGTIQQVLTNPNANPKAILASANNTFQTQYLNKLNK